MFANDYGYDCERCGRECRVNPCPMPERAEYGLCLPCWELELELEIVQPDVIVDVEK